jgi:hypothetical protein
LEIRYIVGEGKKTVSWARLSTSPGFGVGQMGSGTRGRDDMGREFRLWYGTKLLSGQHTAPFRLGAVVGLHTSCAWIGCSR